jgi:hypothetical protein
VRWTQESPALLRYWGSVTLPGPDRPASFFPSCGLTHQRRFRLSAASLPQETGMREITSGVSPPRASGSPRKAKPRQSGQVCMRNLGWSSPSTAGRYGEHRACQNFSSKARERSLNARILGVEYSDRGSNLMANPLASGPGHTGHIIGH